MKKYNYHRLTQEEKNGFLQELIGNSIQLPESVDMRTSDGYEYRILFIPEDTEGTFFVKGLITKFTYLNTVFIGPWDLEKILRKLGFQEVVQYVPTDIFEDPLLAKEVKDMIDESLR